MVRTRGLLTPPTTTAEWSAGHRQMVKLLPQYGHMKLFMMSTVGSQLEGLPALKSMRPLHQLYGSKVLTGLLLAYSSRSALSSVYMRQAMASCRWLFMHCTPQAFSLARLNAGSSIAA